MITEVEAALLAELAALGENWDSYGALPVTPKAIATARAFVDRLGDGIARPAIVPRNHGGIQLEWHHDLGYLEFHIDPRGIVQSYYAEPTLGHVSYFRAQDLGHTTVSLVGGFQIEAAIRCAERFLAEEATPT